MSVKPYPQIPESASQPVTYTAEQRLIAAALMRAIQDYAVRHHPKFRERYTNRFGPYWEHMLEIEDFFSPEEFYASEPFSFVWMCQALAEDWEGLCARILRFIEAGDFSMLFCQQKTHKVYKALFH